MQVHEFIAQKLMERRERANSMMQKCHACRDMIFPGEWEIVDGFRAHRGECADAVRRERAW